MEYQTPIRLQHPQTGRLELYVAFKKNETKQKTLHHTVITPCSILTWDTRGNALNASRQHSQSETTLKCLTPECIEQPIYGLQDDGSGTKTR